MVDWTEKRRSNCLVVCKCRLITSTIYHVRINFIEMFKNVNKLVYTMARDPGILCYQHCDGNKKIFTFSFPKFCDLCQEDLTNAELRIPPFRIPYPFKIASQEPTSIVIRPTNGDFLDHYMNSSNLHIGVTDSTGCVYEYDLNGVTKSYDPVWNQSLIIKILEKIDNTLKCHWDVALNHESQQKCWNAARYNSESYNCYSFVLAFLSTLHLEELRPFIKDKTIFCEHFILPKTRIAAKYIGLYRQLKDKGTILQ